jgi:hypothetical protein
MFSIFGPEDHYSGISNENYTQNLKECTNDCSLCQQLKNIKIDGGGFFEQRENDCHKVKVGSLINDYNLADHGFCVLKTSNKSNLKQGIVNQVLELDRDGNKMKFGSIGQEELDLGGTRDILDIGTHLCPDMLLKKKVKGNINDYLNMCQNNVENYLSKFTNLTYKEKGRTFLRNEGTVGYQRIHFDTVNKCNCC